MAEDKAIETDKATEIVPILGVQRRWVDIALKIFSVVFFVYAFFVFRDELSTGKLTMDTAEAVIVHLAAFSIFEVAVLIVIFQGVDILMYLTERFRAKLRKDVREAKAEGIAVGKTEVSQAVIAWNTRRLDAEAKGVPFDEPLPVEPQENAQ